MPGLCLEEDKQKHKICPLLLTTSLLLNILQLLKKKLKYKGLSQVLLYLVTKCILWLKLDAECRCKWGATCQLDIIMYMYIYKHIPDICLVPSNLKAVFMYLIPSNHHIKNCKKVIMIIFISLMRNLML